MHAELREDALEVRLHGEDADPQIRTDLRGAPTTREQAEDLALARGQPFERLAGRLRASWVDGGDEAREVMVGKHDLAGGRPDDRVAEPCRVDLADQDAARAGAHELTDDPRLLALYEHDELRRGMGRPSLRGATRRDRTLGDEHDDVGRLRGRAALDDQAGVAGESVEGIS